MPRLVLFKMCNKFLISSAMFPIFPISRATSIPSFMVIFLLSSFFAISRPTPGSIFFFSFLSVVVSRDRRPRRRLYSDDYDGRRGCTTFYYYYCYCYDDDEFDIDSLYRYRRLSPPTSCCSISNPNFLRLSSRSPRSPCRPPSLLSSQTF